MKYSFLGKTDIRVSRICVGCMSFGDHSVANLAWTQGEEQMEAALRRALDLGINFFDSSNNYSGGSSELFLGRAMKRCAKREELVIASKVYFNEGKLSKEAIVREIEGSLRRLGTDYLDLYIAHRFDYDTPIEETMEAFDSLQRAGKVRAIGASSMYAYQFYSMQIAAKENGWAPFVSMQDHYNLLYREEEREMLPLCRQLGVSVTPYSPLAAGRLCHLERDFDSPRRRIDSNARFKYDGTMDADAAIVERVHELAQRHGCSMSCVALAWQLAKGICAPIVGAGKCRYLEEAAAATELELSAEEIAYLQEPYRPHRLIGPYDKQ